MRKLKPRADTGTRRPSLRRFFGVPGGLLILAVVLFATTSLAPARAGATGTAAQPAQAFTNAVLIDGTGAPAVDHATVIIRGATIEAAGPAGQVKIPAGAAVTDLHGKVLMDSVRHDLNDIIHKAEDNRTRRIAQWHQQVHIMLLVLLFLALGMGVLIGLFTRNRLHTVSAAYRTSLEILGRRAEELFQAGNSC